MVYCDCTDEAFATTDFQNHCCEFKVSSEIDQRAKYNGCGTLCLHACEGKSPVSSAAVEYCCTGEKRADGGRERRGSGTLRLQSFTKMHRQTQNEVVCVCVDGGKVEPVME